MVRVPFRLRIGAAFLVAALSSSILSAEESVLPQIQPEESGLASAPVTLTSGSTILLFINEALSSKTSKQGDRFSFHVAADVVVNGQVVIPEGATGYGEVIHADNAGMGGKPGELILSARAIETDGRIVELRRFRFGAPENLSGTDRSSTAATMAIAGSVVPVLGIGSLLVKGGEFEVPKGTLAHALTKQAVTFDTATRIEGADMSVQERPNMQDF